MAGHVTECVGKSTRDYLWYNLLIIQFILISIKMDHLSVLFLFALLSVVFSLPVDNSLDKADQEHIIRKRFINPQFNIGAPDTEGIVRIRTKRSYSECEKLHLCKLHARAGLNFFAAYELYFINKENARQWDHRARSPAECEQRFGDCYRK